MRRREFITLLGGAAAWPVAARAQQQERVATISVLRPIAANDPDARPSATAFQQGMQELGWIEGRNLRIDWRWMGTSDVTRIRSYATEVVALKPDVILVAGTPVVAAVREQTRTIPIVFVQVVDPIAAGLVASLARPGSNLTGFTNFRPPDIAQFSD